MKIRVIILTSIILVMGLGMWGFAQVGEERRVQPPVTVMGDDVGFRIEAYKGNTVLGTLVVRVKGKWIDAQLGGGPLTKLSAK